MLSMGFIDKIIDCASGYSIKNVNIAFNAIVLVFGLLTFGYLFLFVETDMTGHATLVQKCVRGESQIPANFLYYIAIYLFSGLNTELLALGTTLVLSTALLFKFIISKKLITYLWNANNPNVVKVNLLAITLLFIFALPTQMIFSGKMYLGSFVANVWHNSTTIMVMPFVLLLFYMTVKLLKEFKFKTLCWICLLMVLNVLTKPSYMFVYIPLFFAFSLYTYRLSAKSLYISLSLLVTGGLIIAEYLLIYKYYGGSGDDVIIDPLKVYANSIGMRNLQYLSLPVGLVAIFLSYLFPILLYIKRKPSMIDWFAIISVFGSILIHLLFCETGNRMWHGNFYWQVVMSSYILFLLSSVRFFQSYSASRCNSIDKKLYIIWLIQVSCGVVYFLKVIIVGNYY